MTITLQNPEMPPAIFFLAGIAGFLARVENKSSIAIAHDGRVTRITVDLSLPFAELMAQVRVERAASAAMGHTLAITPATNTDDDLHQQKPDAYLRFSASGPLHRREDTTAGDAPVFAVQKIDGSWSISIAAIATAAITNDETKRHLAYLESLLESAALDPSQPTATLRLSTEAAALEQYRDLNRTAIAVPLGITVLDLFAAQARRLGDTTAVAFENSVFSYTELDAQSTALASILQARGASQSLPVAICLPRSELLPLVLLAALKAGSYYVPLDPSHPKQRLLDILEECKPAVVLVSPETQPLFAESSLPLLDPATLPESALPESKDTGAATTGAATASTKPSPLKPSPDDRAYMIYTSGTTGRPKGVIIHHGSLTNLLIAMRHRPGLAQGDRMLAVASLSFDIAMMDMFLPLISGARLVIASERAARDPASLARLLEEHAITCMQATPVTWRMLVSSGQQLRPGLKMISGGEALSRDLASTLLRMGGELWNCYGPTETTIYSSVLRVDEGHGRVPIGPPMPNTVFYIADPAGQLLPPELTGELCIGGSGVAEGYFERPELNNERFVPDHWTSTPAHGDAGHMKPKLFRTGDLVRRVPAAVGTPGSETGFEIFGRIDHQVKLRGYRIELGEIETVLRAHPSIADAAVLLREDEPGEPWLVGYVTRNMAVGAAGQKELLAFATGRLPQYMRPSCLVTLPALPLTGSGKVDRRALAALPAPLASEDTPLTTNALTTEATAEKALTSTETALLRIFREVLRLKSFGPNDNFFEYGGYSLLAIRLFAKIDSALHTKLPITALFDAPTVRQLATLIGAGNPLQALVPIRATGSEPPFFLIHSYLLYGLIGDVVDPTRPVYGLRERTVPGATLDLEQCVTEYAQAIHRMWPAGPVHVGGWCAAGILTIEIARRLMAEGRQVGMLALFDADAPGFTPRPVSGSRRIARLRATWAFHVHRIRGLNWKERLDYIQERLTQAPLNLIERFYSRNHARIARYRLKRRRRYFSWIPSIIFDNQFTQTGELQTQSVAPLHAAIQLFRARDVTTIAGSDTELGWGSVARLGVQVHFIPGHHESMFLEPNVDTLRKEFQASMHAAENPIQRTVISDRNS